MKKYISEVLIIEEYCYYGNIQQYLLQQRNYFVNQITLDDILDYDIQTTPKYFE